jgi:Reverse transcriptase (RNA-dependent DNA polymerase)
MNCAQCPQDHEGLVGEQHRLAFAVVCSSDARSTPYHEQIQHIFRKRNGYQYFTKLDISMQYYTFELDEDSRNLCTICTSFGSYRYNLLPMGIKQSPDIAQQIMEDLFRNCDDVDVYIDDIGVFSTTWEDHLQGTSDALHQFATSD